MDKPVTRNSDERKLRRERWELLRELNRLLEPPMIALAFVWLALLIHELVWGFHPTVQFANYVIWGLFAVDFLVKLAIAPHRRRFIRNNWLTLISLMLPALRIARLFRVFRMVRLGRTAGSLRLVRLVTSLNRGMRATRRTLAKRRVGYVIAVTLIVALAGAAGMLAFENNSALREAGYRGDAPGLNTYGEALWWTAMLLTTMGSQYWPHTLEGRILTLLLSLYAFAVFGYITATLASHFIGRDTENEKEAESGIQRQLLLLRAEIERLSARLPKDV